MLEESRAFAATVSEERCNEMKEELKKKFLFNVKELLKQLPFASQIEVNVSDNSLTIHVIRGCDTKCHTMYGKAAIIDWFKTELKNAGFETSGDSTFRADL